jgi:hypothetical protein
MTSEQLVAFVERKLEEHGIGKIIPDEDTLKDAYRLFERGRRIEKTVEKALRKFEKDEHDSLEVPKDLAGRVRKILANDSALRWDQAVARIVGATKPRLSLDPKDHPEDGGQ